MKMVFKKLFFLICFLLLSPGFIYAVNLPWSTSFNYPECTQRGAGGAKDCQTVQNDGIMWSWGANGVGGNYTQVNANANYPGGKGGNGFRAFVGDGTNYQSAPVRVDFPAPQKELWIRWYQRYEKGFRWESNNIHYDKTLYIRTDPQGSCLIPSFRMNSYRLDSQGTPSTSALSASGGWQMVHGGSESDGSWHSYEIHIKMDTNSSNGVARMWVDGKLMAENKSVNYSAGRSEARQGWRWFDFHQNQNSPASGRIMYVDYDDIAIYNTKPPNVDAHGNPFIGPVSGTGPVSGGVESPIALPTPKNLTIKSHTETK